MNKNYLFIIFLFCCSFNVSAQCITLDGKWSFKVDSLREGIKNEWYNHLLDDEIILPGSMATNCKGDKVTADTKWTGGMWGTQWFKEDKYAPYRDPENTKVSFWLQPDYYYVGMAWYQKQISIPSSWDGKSVTFVMERPHWQTQVWIDGKRVGENNSLSVPHTYDITPYISSGTHTLTVLVDNAIIDVNPGRDAHSVSDNTQSNWNGIIGEIALVASPATYIKHLSVVPNVDNATATFVLEIEHRGKPQSKSISYQVLDAKGNSLPLVSSKVKLEKGKNEHSFEYSLGKDMQLWDEFTPNLYTVVATLDKKDVCTERFGMREISAEGKQLMINNRPLYIRGTLECCIFPKTGFPPTDKKEWARIMDVIKDFGLNHLRFHSWCPPTAAFEAADEAGVYLQVEMGMWTNLGDDAPQDNFAYVEAERVLRAHGNHPSFTFMLCSNEPAGKNHAEFLTKWVDVQKKSDSRRLYSSGAGWPALAVNDYNNIPAPRIQHWGGGVNSIINAETSSTDFDWTNSIQFDIPTISHEIGQWCVYPNLNEIPKYNGVLKAKNFEIYRDFLSQSGMLHLANDFLMASGKLQALCYKADIEAALRTPQQGGFQLLDLHDFPGQGTALVGVLDPFWDEKGYITAEEFSRFCNSTVPLVRMPKMVYTNNETFKATLESAHFGATPLEVIPTWSLSDAQGKVIASHTMKPATLPIGNCHLIGDIVIDLSSVKTPQQLILTATLSDFSNSWDIWVYPEVQEPTSDKVRIVQQLDELTQQFLEKGGDVILSLPKGTLKPEMANNSIGFSSIFWNTSWTNNQLPISLGILCNPQHEALRYFPTQYHSNYQWRDIVANADAVILDSLAVGLQPIVRVIDDWFMARPLGLIVECKVGKGRLIFSTSDLITDNKNRPEARQLLHSLSHYIVSDKCRPTIEVTTQKLISILK